MREILFRGKRVGNGAWVEGSLFQSKNYVSIWSEKLREDVEVDPATIGQYTGLQDMNGTKIFEGDIISIPYWRGRRVTRMKGIIEFYRGAFSVIWQDEKYGKYFAGYVADMKVIGNIFDNPELLEENQ